jgi:hypothetical protein
VHVGPPGHAGPTHLRRDQCAGRLGRDEQAEATRFRHGRHPRVLVGVPGNGRLQRIEAGRGQILEESGLAGRRRTGQDRIVGYVQTVHPGPQRTERTRFAPAAVVPEQQRLGQFEVVRPADPYTGRKQAGIESGSGRPEPARRLGLLHPGDRGGEVGDRGNGPGGRAVVVQRPQAARATFVNGHRHDHGSILPQRWDISP